MRPLAALAVLTAVCACTAAASDGLRARVSPAPASLSTRVWSPAIVLTRKGKPAAAPLALRIRRGSTTRSFKARAVRKGAYRVRVAFPVDGRWAWSLLSRRAVLARGAVTVSTAVRFELPYDMAVAPDGDVYFLDGGRILRWDGRRVRVHATTPATELAGLARIADGTLYATDVAAGGIYRIDPARPARRIATLPRASDVVADAAGTTLWVTSIEGGVYRLDPASGALARVADATESHGLDRDAAGNLYVHDGRTIARIDARTGAKTTVARVDAFKLLVAPDGVLYGLTGDPSGGRVLRVAQDGSVTPVAGTGKLGPYADGRALEVGILPSALQFAPDGSLLVAQVQPVAAIRRVDLAAGTITTVVRGR